VRGWGGTVLLAELLPTAAGFGNGGSTKLNEEKVDGAN
jgi:hypothetical protein